MDKVSGRAAREGILTGDVVLGVNNNCVETMRELQSHLEAAGRSAAVPIQRDDEILFIPLSLNDG